MQCCSLTSPKVTLRQPYGYPCDTIRRSFVFFLIPSWYGIRPSLLSPYTGLTMPYVLSMSSRQLVHVVGPIHPASETRYFFFFFCVMWLVVPAVLIRFERLGVRCGLKVFVAFVDCLYRAATVDKKAEGETLETELSPKLFRYFFRT